MYPLSFQKSNILPKTRMHQSEDDNEFISWKTKKNVEGNAKSCGRLAINSWNYRLNSLAPAC